MPLLHWFNREADLTKAARAPYRLLEPVPSLHYGEEDSPNMLIEGDNLDALKALLPYYAGQVKCIFIDPPYNTKSAFEHYDDNLEHAQWLSMMYPRLELLRELLHEFGSLWITIDDNEAHYLKVLCDEVFGRRNFVGNVVWEKVYTPKSNGRGLSSDHDHILVYAKSEQWLERGWNLIPRSEEQQGRFKNPDFDPRGPWRTYPLDVRTEDGAKREKYRYEVSLPSGRVVRPSPGRHWALPKERFEEERAAGEIYFGKNGDSAPTRKVYLKDARSGVIARTWWPYKEVGGNQDAKREVLTLFGDSGFITPKPEALIHRILTIATNPADLVLDSFLGSGTTAAVAHKMGRRWVGIEVGDHARTHCLPRLRKVVDGEQGGISHTVGWPENGGGGFSFFKLGPPVFDENGRIRDGIKFEHLAAHVWFSETGTPRTTRAKREPFLGEHRGIGYYLLYNGILGDKSNGGGNVLTKMLLRDLPAFDGPRVIYGEACLLSDDRLRELNITFKQTPYDIKAR